jgi:hypothetical protein
MHNIDKKLYEYKGTSGIKVLHRSNGRSKEGRKEKTYFSP